MKTAELEGAKLDYWVAKALGWKHPDGRMIREWLAPAGAVPSIAGDSDFDVDYEPSTNWAHGGLIIARERIALVCSRPRHDTDQGATWDAIVNGDYVGPDGQVESRSNGPAEGCGPTPLIAAMRAFVASKFGEEVPDA